MATEGYLYEDRYDQSLFHLKARDGWVTFWEDTSFRVSTRSPPIGARLGAFHIPSHASWMTMGGIARDYDFYYSGRVIFAKDHNQNMLTFDGYWRCVIGQSTLIPTRTVGRVRIRREGPRATP